MSSEQCGVRRITEGPQNTRRGRETEQNGLACARGRYGGRPERRMKKTFAGEMLTVFAGGPAVTEGRYSLEVSGGRRREERGLRQIADDCGSGQDPPRTPSLFECRLSSAVSHAPVSDGHVLGRGRERTKPARFVLPSTDGLSDTIPRRDGSETAYEDGQLDTVK